MWDLEETLLRSSSSSNGALKSTERAISAELLEKIQQMPLAEPDPEHSFEAKLAYERNWTQGYAARVVQEYRKFLYLTQVALRPIAPSDDVDHAWHLHLLQTHHYWEVFCAKVIGKSLHHTPTLAGTNGRGADISRYTNALAEYQRVFDIEPPQDIWPRVEQRFGKSSLSGVSTQKRTTCPSNLISKVLAFLAILLVVCLFFLAKPILLSLLIAVPLSVQLLVAASMACLSCMALLRWGASGAAPRELDAFEAAYLHGGVHHLVNTALIRLVDLNLVTFDTNGKDGDQGASTIRRKLSQEEQLPASIDPCERAVLQILNAQSQELDGVTEKASQTCSRVRGRLIKAGMLAPEGQIPVFDLLLILWAAAFTALSAVLLRVPEEMAWWVFILGGFCGVPLLLIPAVILPRLWRKDIKTRNAIASLAMHVERTNREREKAQEDGFGSQQAGNLAMHFAVLGSAAVIEDRRFYGINYLRKSIISTAHSGGKAGCGDNLPKCG